ncbi:MAG: hypothetical protein ACKE5M_07520 [Methylophilaceae bacterium]
MEILIIVTSISLIAISIMGVGLNAEIKKVNRAICLLILVFGLIFIVFTTWGEIFVILIKTSFIAIACLSITCLSWVAQLILYLKAKLK